MGWFTSVAQSGGRGIGAVVIALVASVQAARGSTRNPAATSCGSTSPSQGSTAAAAASERDARNLTIRSSRLGWPDVLAAFRVMIQLPLPRTVPPGSLLERWLERDLRRWKGKGLGSEYQKSTPTKKAHPPRRVCFRMRVLPKKSGLLVVLLLRFLLVVLLLGLLVRFLLRFRHFGRDGN